MKPTPFRLSTHGALMAVVSAAFASDATAATAGRVNFVFGEAFVRNASVAALSQITVIEIRSERLQQASENCRHQFNGAFLAMLVDRLALANTRLSQLLAERNISNS